MSEKIKLPWRRFGDEKPEKMTGCLVWTADICFVGGWTDSNTDGHIMRWYPDPWIKGQPWNHIDCVDDDRWIYRSELANPFEEEK